MKQTLFKNKIPLLLLLSLFSIEGIAQNTGWQWAKSGGGTSSTGSSENNNGSYTRDLEQILDIKIDADNNYYYLANITSGSSQIDGIPVTTYNTLNGNPNSNTDILLFSTTADGTYRWHRVIGGTNPDNAWNIQLDNENGIYIGAMANSSATETSGRLPTRFSETDILPFVDASNTEPQYGYKTSFLLKYNTANGDLVWRKDIQGNVAANKRQSSISQLQIDSSNTIHAVVGLREGTHLDGQVVITPSDENGYEYYLVKYDTSGTLTEPPVPLPVDGGLIPSKTSFRYDETLNRYYFAGGRRTHDGTTVLTDLSYNGLPFTQDGYILAINAETLEELWRKEITASYDTALRDIYEIEIEEDSGIYLGGRFVNSPETPGVSFNGHILNNALIGYIPFIIKLDADGNVLWHKIPDSHTDNYYSPITHNGFDVAINGNEVALATEGSYFVWGDFQIDRPIIGMSGHRTDPVLVRFNKETGAVVGLNDVMGTFGFSDALTAVTVDNQGAYVVGGYMRSSLFTDNPNGVDAISSSNSSIDFFYAKLTVDTSAATKDFNTININIYPNPTNDMVNIETQETLQNYEVYNVLGQQIQKGMFGSNNQINLHGATAGTYFIKVTTIQGSTATVKVVKQ